MKNATSLSSVYSGDNITAKEVKSAIIFFFYVHDWQIHVHTCTLYIHVNTCIKNLTRDELLRGTQPNTCNYLIEYIILNIYVNQLNVPKVTL